MLFIRHFFFSLFSFCRATNLLKVAQPVIEDCSQASITIKTFYGQNNNNRKVPFYLRYSQGCNKQSPLKEFQNICQLEQDIDATHLESIQKNECQKPVSCKRPCYYQEPEERKKYVAALKSFSLVKKTVENIGTLTSQTSIPVSHSMSMSTKSAEERKFFKNRSVSESSTSEGNTVTGTAVIKRGFNLSFVPRRLSSSFDKKVKNHRKGLYLQRKKRHYSKNNTVIEKPLSPLSKVFPELYLDSQSSTTSSTSGTELTTISQVEDPVSCKTSEVGNENTYWSMLVTPVKNSNDVSTSSPCLSTLSDSESIQSQKLFSIFSYSRQKAQSQSCLVPPSESNILMPRFIKDSEDLRQMTLDAGQKKFGAIQCLQCGMVYTQADPLDETTHAKFHHSVLATLKFPGWKKERIVQEYPELGSRIIMVMPDDQRYALRKVEEINRMMSQELGFPDSTLSFCHNYKVFLYISEEKRVDGCCVAESITKGYRVIPCNSTAVCVGRRPWCCQAEPEPAAIGISKIWVYGPSRRKGVASKMLDCVRYWFEYGVPVEQSKLAFSDPTPDGMQMARKYTGTSAFLVYKCQLQ